MTGLVVAVDADALFAVLNWTGVPPDGWSPDAKAAWRTLMSSFPDHDRRLITPPRVWQRHG
ncbi:hypothetical protein [Luteipulveratus mongoliensis]|uniref:Uncharacterized protein n=1 Tax=Luteipulveratus mongoliensis TaxID=571913 RepID=A0A0K1JEK2_9MICO|nr:hypothetical protein [Luteipulveratus mongoliensis]AKU15142.1 hypothetical protein VV02_03455 [Luteipulveratus mongoliensis]